MLFPNVVLSSITVTDELILLACETCLIGLNAGYSSELGPGWIKVYDRISMKLYHSIEGSSPSQVGLGSALSVTKDTDHVYKIWYSTRSEQNLGELTLRSICLTRMSGDTRIW